MNKYKFNIIKWYDTITPESAENGDYDSCGNEERSWGTDSIVEAAQWHADKLSEIGFYEINDYCGVSDYASSVAYACDGDVDYSTGSQDYDRIALQAELTARQRQAYNILVERAIARINYKRA